MSQADIGLPELDAVRSVADALRVAADAIRRRAPADSPDACEQAVRLLRDLATRAGNDMAVVLSLVADVRFEEGDCDGASEEGEDDGSGAIGHA